MRFPREKARPTWMRPRLFSLAAQVDEAAVEWVIDASDERGFAGA